jgi:hypothetical protein
MVVSYFNGCTLITGIFMPERIALIDAFRHYGIDATHIPDGIIHAEDAQTLDKLHGDICVGGTFHNVTTRHMVYAMMMKYTIGIPLGDDISWQIAGRVLREWCLP